MKKISTSLMLAMSLAMACNAFAQAAPAEPASSGSRTRVASPIQKLIFMAVTSSQ